MKNLRKEIRQNEFIKKAMRKLVEEFGNNSFYRFFEDDDCVVGKEIYGTQSEYISYFGTREVDLKNNVDVMFFVKSMASSITITFDYITKDVLFEEEFKYIHANSGKNSYTARIIYHANTNTIERMS